MVGFGGGCGVGAGAMVRWLKGMAVGRLLAVAVRAVGMHRGMEVAVAWAHGVE